MHSKLPVPSLPGGYTVGCEGVNKTLNMVEMVCLIHNKRTARVTSERLGKVNGIKVSTGILILISDVTHESRHKMQSIFLALRCVIMGSHLVCVNQVETIVKSGHKSVGCSPLTRLPRQLYKLHSHPVYILTPYGSLCILRALILCDPAR